MSRDDLFATVSSAIASSPDLKDLSPKVKRRLARQSARAVAGWWPERFTPDYVAQNADQVREHGVANLEPTLVVGFGPLISLLASTVLSTVARWIISAIIEWVLSRRQAATAAIMQYREKMDVLPASDSPATVPPAE